MNKYVIKNCPVCLRNHKNVCIKSIRHSAFVNASETELYKPCKDITDCVLKRIVENLKTCLEDNTCDNCDGVGYYDGCQDIKCAVYQARKCIEMLEIEECENE